MTFAATKERLPIGLSRHISVLCGHGRHRHARPSTMVVRETHLRQRQRLCDALVSSRCFARMSPSVFGQSDASVAGGSLSAHCAQSRPPKCLGDVHGHALGLALTLGTDCLSTGTLLFRKEMLTLHWSIMLIHMCSTASARWRLANWGALRASSP
jgi:hypothetical protein